MNTHLGFSHPHQIRSRSALVQSSIIGPISVLRVCQWSQSECEPRQFWHRVLSIGGLWMRKRHRVVCVGLRWFGMLFSSKVPIVSGLFTWRKGQIIIFLYLSTSQQHGRVLLLLLLISIRFSKYFCTSLHSFLFIIVPLWASKQLFKWLNKCCTVIIIDTIVIWKVDRSCLNC